MTDFRIIRTSELVLPPHANIRRLPPREPEFQQPDYLERFDAQTVFCDVFRSGEDLVLVGPPLLNLEERFTDASYSLDGSPVPPPSFTALNRAQRGVIAGHNQGDDLLVDYDVDHSATLRIRSDLSSLFDGMNVLAAMQRNNELRWIRDWASFYVSVNDVQALALYDMRSNLYRMEDIAEALQGIRGLETVVIVDWPYKYGVPAFSNGQPWDSDYCQYVAWEHCRRRFLRSARAVTIADLDELFLADDGRSIFAHAEDDPHGVVRFKQRFIEPAVKRHPTDAKTRTYADYLYYLPEKPLSTPKWAAILPRLEDKHQLLIHSVGNNHSAFSDVVIGRQFRAMKLAWQRKSFDRHHPDVQLTRAYEKDAVLARAFDRVAQVQGR